MKQIINRLNQSADEWQKCADAQKKLMDKGNVVAAGAWYTAQNASNEFRWIARMIEDE